MKQTTRITALLLLPLAAWWTGCWDSAGAEQPSPYLNVADDVAYVGDASCAQCHGEIAESYATHGMAQSFYPMTEDVAVEDFDGTEVKDPTGGFVYTARRDGDRFVQEERQVGPDGRVLNRLVRTMDYVVGSGSAARTYLTDEGGVLRQLPLTWYTQSATNPEQGTTVGDAGAEASGYWAFSPGYETSNGRFGRAVPPACMSCHNGTSPPVEYVDGAYQDLAMGIGCEQCHGPGELHVEARTIDPEAADSVDYTIVNPEHLELDLRLDVCQQCHLNGTVSVIRDGETADSYRPSRPLSAHRALFVVANEDPNAVDVISHADRMKASACFTESAAMDCVTCHDPHEGFREKPAAYFNDTCAGCHAPDALAAAMPTAEAKAQHAVGADCFSCHMPKVTADDAPHASFTDHYIRVVGDDAVTGVATSGELEPYFERDQGTEEGETYLAMATVVYGRRTGDRAELTKGAALLDRVAARETAPGEAKYLLGFTRTLLGQDAAAIEPLRAAIGEKATPERLNTLAQAMERVGRPAADVEALYTQALQIQPAAAEVRVNYGRFLEATGRLPAALDAYTRAASDRPDLAAAHANRGRLLARQGDIDGAVDALDQAVTLEPGDGAALADLGAILAQSGAADRAGTLFARAVRADPGNADAQANYALYLAQTGQIEQAVEAVRRALQLNPQQPTAQQLAASLAQNGIQV